MVQFLILENALKTLQCFKNILSDVQGLIPLRTVENNMETNEGDD